MMQSSATPTAPIACIADQDRDAAVILETLFGHAGLPAVAVRSGDELLTAVRQRRPALVIAELYLPGSYGSCVLAALKGDPELRDLPVLVHSAHVALVDREWALHHGADGFLAKPSGSAELLREARRLMRQD